ncbi:GDSL esterase/lipase-like [Forsythia ovata]|uniref:GDSL esterase/lipase-like n=1 Tax=Forsythia ovata TaxID=205694 RepID=A0ABD1P720_9LAMI
MYSYVGTTPGGLYPCWNTFSLWSHWQGSVTPPVAATIFFGANDAALLGRTIYARQCVELAFKELGLPSIDLWSKLQETEGWQKKFLSDGLHLTPEGNAVVHEEVERVFNEAGVSASNMGENPENP